MPLPGGVNTITVTGTHVDTQGLPKVGSVEFVLSTSVADSVDHLVIASGGYAVDLVNGSYSVLLPCTDNASLSPSGFYYAVTEKFVGGRPTYAVLLPHTLGPTVDDSTFAAVPLPTPPYGLYGLLAQSNVWIGALNDFTGSRITVATPASSGHVANKAYVDAAVGGGGALLAVNNLSDLASAGTSRVNLGLGSIATRNVGTSAGTAAAGDDSRITGAVQASAATTKGDLLAATAASTLVRLGVGTEGQVLTASSAASTGLAWSTPSAAASIVAPFSVAGALSVSAYDYRWYNDTGRTLTFGTVRASVGVAPTSAAVIVDVLKDNVTIFTTSANRPTVASGANTAVNSSAPDVTTIANGHYLTVSVAQVGVGTTGSDLTVQVNMS